MIYLIKENIFSISALGREFFQISILTNTMLLTKLLPELASDCLLFRLCTEVRFPGQAVDGSSCEWVQVQLTAVAALAGLDGNNLSAKLASVTKGASRAIQQSHTYLGMMYSDSQITASRLLEAKGDAFALWLRSQG